MAPQEQHSDRLAAPPAASDHGAAQIAGQLAEQLRLLTACMAESERLQVYRAVARLLEPAAAPND